MLRNYQREALSNIVLSLGLDGNDLCILPTGAGKSHIISALASAVKCPILILQPSKEILEQNFERLQHYIPKSEIGVYSASMNSQTINNVTLATIQSIYKKPNKFTGFKLVIVDECHLVNPESLTGMYSKFFQAIGNPKVYGFTATPYRQCVSYKKMGTNLYAVTSLQMINRLPQKFWKRIIFSVSIQTLIDNKYLTPIRYFTSKDVVIQQPIQLNLFGPISTNIYSQPLEYLKNQTDRQVRLLHTLNFLSVRYKTVLVFCESLKEASFLASVYPNSVYIYGSLAKSKRDNIIANLKAGKYKFVFNVGVFTTGFDYPELDCILLLRPLKSLALFYQILGRGVRTYPGKLYCDFYDLTNTTQKLGRIETIEITKNADNEWDVRTEKGFWHGKPLTKHKIPNFFQKQLNKLV